LWSAGARSDFEPAAAFSAPVAACDDPAKHTKSPVTNINAERPLALIVIWQSPRSARPGAKKDPTPCPQRGRKRESSGNTGQKQGSAPRFRRASF
jgi:hypothetical protein